MSGCIAVMDFDKVFTDLHELYFTNSSYYMCTLGIFFDPNELYDACRVPFSTPVLFSGTRSLVSVYSWPLTGKLSTQVSVWKLQTKPNIQGKAVDIISNLVLNVATYNTLLSETIPRMIIMLNPSQFGWSH